MVLNSRNKACSGSKTFKSSLKDSDSFDQTADLLNSKEATVRVSEREREGGEKGTDHTEKDVGEPKICTSPTMWFQLSAGSNVVIVDQKTSAKESIDNKQQSTDFEDE